jgi:hypothetical protein
MLVGSAIVSAVGIGLSSGIGPGDEARLRPWHGYLAMAMDAILLAPS